MSFSLDHSPGFSAICPQFQHVPVHWFSWCMLIVSLLCHPPKGICWGSMLLQGENVNLRNLIWAPLVWENSYCSQVKIILWSHTSLGTPMPRMTEPQIVHMLNSCWTFKTQPKFPSLLKPNRNHSQAVYPIQVRFHGIVNNNAVS